MRYNILFIIALILVSGFIAYFGDLLGRKMGKKRLTLFNMRPRHTAVLVTTLTGMVIAGMALFALAMVDEEFKQVLTRGEEILKQNQALSDMNTQLEDRMKRLRDRSKQLEVKVEHQEREVVAARDRANQALIDKENAVKAVSRLEKDIARRKRELDQLRKKSATTDAELKDKAAQLQQVQEEYNSAQKRLEEAETILAQAESKLATAEARLAETQRQLDNTKNQLVLTQEELVDVQGQLASTQEQLEREREALEAANRQVDQKYRQYLKLRQHFQDYAAEIRGGDIILRQGDEVARGVISPKQTRPQIRAALRELLDTASERAAKLGAAKDGSGKAVKLIFVADRATNSLVDDEDKCLDAAVDLVKTSIYNDVLFRVVTFANTLSGEQVLVEFKPYFNYLLYREGDKIAETVLDGGNDSEGPLLLSIVNFLHKDVAKAALKKGIIPTSSPDRLAASGQNPQEQVDALMDVVNEIVELGAVVRVEAYASKDIYSADSLNMDNLRLRVVKLQ